MSEHSPLPWEQDSEYWTAMNDAQGNSVEVGQANMDLVLNAVNSNPALVAENALLRVALEDLCEGIEQHWADQSLDHAAMTARVLLAAVAGKAVSDE